MRKISESYSLRKDAVDYGIKTIEEKMTEYAKRGLRECYVSFHYHPGPFKEFKEKYGDSEEYREFDVEKEIREYFTGNGFIQCIFDCKLQTADHGNPLRLDHISG